MKVDSVDKLAQVARQRGHPFDILIVDDERYVREVFRDYCDLSAAFTIELAGSGQEAVEKVTRKEYDLVTMDLIMPELSGLDALAAIKKVRPQLPIVVITGNATDKLVERAGVLGACRVLYKPVLLEHFITELTSVLTPKAGPESPVNPQK